MTPEEMAALGPTDCGGSSGTGRWPVRCGAALLTDEQKAAGLCGRHLAGARRSAAAEARRTERYREDQERADVGHALAARLHGAGLFSARVHHQGFGEIQYTGGVVLSAADVETVLAWAEARRA